MLASVVCIQLIIYIDKLCSLLSYWVNIKCLQCYIYFHFRQWLKQVLFLHPLYLSREILGAALCATRLVLSAIDFFMLTLYKMHILLCYAKYEFCEL